MLDIRAQGDNEAMDFLKSLQIMPSALRYAATAMKQVRSTAHGSSIAQAHQQAFAWIGQQVKIQASLLAYTDVFWTLMLISARGF